MLVKKDSFLFSCSRLNVTQKIFNFVLTTLLMTQHFSYAASNSIANDILSPNSTAYDFTFTDDANSSIYLNKTYIEVSQVVKEIEKIANALVPRDINVANCSTTGCPIDAVQCDAVTELPSCPDGSVLNTTRDMCQKDPDVFDCPSGFTYDNDLKQCIKPLDCPNGGTYSIERNRCEFKRIYECPTGYTQDGDTCIAPPTCPSGAVFNASLLKCTIDSTMQCKTGWTFNNSTKMCEKEPFCIAGIYNTALDKCTLDFIKSCPTGYILSADSSRCEVSPTCASGTTYNATTNRCEKSIVCPNGTSWDSNLNTCSVTTTCTAPSTLNSATNRCEYTTSSNNCPSGTTFNSGTGTCTASPICPSGGSYDTSKNLCTSASTGISCVSGYTYSATHATCIATPTCAQGTYNATFNKCLLAYTPSCASGYTYNTTRARCEKAPPNCPSGTTYNATTNRCEQGANSACTISGGTWNGTNCAVGSNYPATANNNYSSCSINKLNYTNAESYCNNLNEGGFSDWRMPKILESASGEGQGVNGVPSCGNWTWTSTTSYEGFGFRYAWFGASADPSAHIGNTYYVRCVRGTNPGTTTTYTCPSGGTLSGTTCINTSNVAPSCPVGYTHDGSGRCYANPTCPSSGTFDGTNDVCHLTYSKSCPTGMTYDSTSNSCIASAVCSNGGSLNTSIDQCTIAGTNNCKSGYAWNSGYTTCTATSSCVAGTTLNTTTDKCQVAGGYTCNSTFSLTGTTCYKSPACTVGTYSTSSKKCDAGSSTSCSGLSIDVTKDICYSSSSCLSGGNFDISADKCWFSYSSSCTSGTLDINSSKCVLDAICDFGSLNTSLNKCQVSQDRVCNSGTIDLTTGKCTFTATCQSGATLDSKGCNQEKIPLICPNGTDTLLDVCYSDINACKIDSSYPKSSTLAYSDALNTCIVDENVVCAPSLTWSELYKKCEAVPICYNGMYNPENDFCYISTKECPTNSAYPCIGPIGNKWCSPYNCNPTTNQCGYAECPGGIQPSSTAEMSPSYNANLIYNASDSLCINSRCDLANSSRFTYCGLEEACPSGFGVFEQSGQCFVRECPAGSFQENNKCYTLGCPKGTTVQGDGKCLVN